jgi:hypothetical protein
VIWLNLFACLGLVCSLGLEEYPHVSVVLWSDLKNTEGLELGWLGRPAQLIRGGPSCSPWSYNEPRPESWEPWVLPLPHSVLPGLWAFG